MLGHQAFQKRRRLGDEGEIELDCGDWLSRQPPRQRLQASGIPVEGEDTQAVLEQAFDHCFTAALRGAGDQGQGLLLLSRQATHSRKRVPFYRDTMSPHSRNVSLLMPSGSRAYIALATT